MMKTTVNRIELLKALAKDGAFAFPNGTIPLEFQTKKAIHLPVVLRGTRNFEQAYLSKSQQKKYNHTGYVWKITDTGRKWIIKAKCEVELGECRLIKETLARQKLDEDFEYQSKLRQIAKQNLASAKASS